MATHIELFHKQDTPRMMMTNRKEMRLSLQQGGMSRGGGSIRDFGSFPSFTMKVVIMPHVKWRSK